jgi:hypothetical protein
MRKSTKLMAGLGVVAGLGVALAPLATFAEAVGTDTLTVTIDVACKLTADGYTAGTGGNTGTPWANHYIGNLEAGSYVDLGSGAINNGTGNPAQATSVNVKCNDPAGAVAGHGWQITATATDLTGQTDNTQKILHTVSPVTDGSASGWGVKLSKTGTGDLAIQSTYADDYTAVASANTVLAKGAITGGTAGDTLNIDGYEVSAIASQAADTYEGSITYTFTAPIPNA